MRGLIFTLLLLTPVVQSDAYTFAPEEFDPSDFTYWVECEDALPSRSSIRMSMGPHKPEDEVFIELPSSSGNVTFHFKLVRVDVEPYVVEEEIIDIAREASSRERIKWNVSLPEDIPAIYRIGLAIEHPHIDTYFYLQTVVVGHESQINASLKLNKKSYECDEDIVFTITNDGSHNIEICELYAVEKKMYGDWKNIPPKGQFMLVVPIIFPGETYTKKIDVPLRFTYLDQGSYRLSQRVSSDYLGVSKTLTTEFTVPMSPRFFWVKLRDLIERGGIFTILVMLPVMAIIVTVLRRRAQQRYEYHPPSRAKNNACTRDIIVTGIIIN